MINDKRIWGGLNRPGVSIAEADVIVFGIDFDGGVSFRAGAKDAPRALREITHVGAPTTERFESIEKLKVLDIGDLGRASREETFKHAEETAYRLVKRGKFFTMIGGDHSTTIPVLKGIDRAVHEPFGIVHLDAHFDLCDHLDGNRLSHGSTQRRALELKNVTDAANIFFVGIRSVELDELDFIGKNKINVIRALDFARLGPEKSALLIRQKMSRFNKIYITIDIDVLDPAYAPGTGTPQFGGLTSRELLHVLYELFKLPVIGFDLVEMAPQLESAKIALFAARKIVTECWGHYYREVLS